MYILGYYNGGFKMQDLLPIGSVVLLKESNKRLMVCGRAQSLVDDRSKTYDYSGCYFPEGILDVKDLFLFDSDDIERIYFIGLQDQEEFELREHIVKFLEENKGEIKEC